METVATVRQGSSSDLLPRPKTRESASVRSLEEVAPLDSQPNAPNGPSPTDRLPL